MSDAIEYRDVPGFPGYRVGSDGSVWSSRSSWRHPGREGEWRRLNGCLTKSGYRVVGLYMRGKGTKTIHVSRLILEAFVGPCPAGMECCHGNGDSRDDRLSNLRWDTPTANNHDKFLHGTHPIGSRTWNAKLTEEKARAIRRRFAEGERRANLAREYEVSYSVIDNVVKYRKWKHC